MSTVQLRRSPIHEGHLEAGGRMVPFAGWELPIQYTGVVDEHLAVRTRAGLFDVSHMGEVSVRGKGALGYLQRVTCNDVGRLRPGRAQYTALTTPSGTFVDDLLIYQRAEGDYLLVVNAANRSKDFEWLVEHRQGFEVELADDSCNWAQLAVQGPSAVDVVQPLTQAQLGDLRYYRFVETAVDGVDCIVSRTGYTGEDGFELYAPAARGLELWRALIRAGEPHGLAPAGLGARDTLRLEARMALYGNDIDDTTTVLEADLGWIVKLAKGEFIGREALEREKGKGSRRKLVGFELRERGIARHGHRVVRQGREVGHVTSGTHAPYLKRSIGLAYLPTESSDVGTEFEIDIRGRLSPAVVVETPFYKRS